MKIYIHEGPGYYIGSCIAVIASNRKEAEKLIIKELDEWGIDEPLNITEKDIIPDTVIITDNGDY